jgi:hypothetical protein
LVRARLASISSLICLSRAFSALARWICKGAFCQHDHSQQKDGSGEQKRTCSTSARLCLKVLPLARW